jgi:hypothetical protein
MYRNFFEGIEEGGLFCFRGLAELETDEFVEFGLWVVEK